MVENIQIFQFMAIQKSTLLYRLLKKTFYQNSIIILDLEDTLSDFDKKKSKILKDWGRKELIKFVLSFRDFFLNKNVGIRINGLSSGEFEKDLKTITEISKIWDLYCIVGPMIESNECIDEYLYNLKNVNYKTFIPIIETIKGINNLDSIAQHKNILYAIYGHNDYSLNSNHWPFLRQDEPEFWEIVSCFINTIESGNIHYIHPPIMHFLNEDLFAQVYLRLHNRCKHSFGVMTINTRQTILFDCMKNAKSKMKEKTLKSRIYSLQEKIDQALYIKKIISKKKRNFVIDLKTKNFFSPHMYISAVKFLEKLDE